MKYKLILIAIILLALFLRVVNINDNPASLYGDELTLVYDAYSLLKTGHDQTGKFMPLTFSMSEGRSPVYVYAAIPIIALFGPNAFSARILSVLSGVGIVILMYLLTNIWLGRKQAFIAAGLTAILPWDIALSRAGFETHLALFFSLLGIFALLKAKVHQFWLIISAMAFGLSIHTYHSYKIVLPLFLLLLIWFVNFQKDFLNKKHLLMLLISGFIFFSFVLIWLSQISQGSDVRFSTTNIFGQTDLRQKLIQNINNERSISSLPKSLAVLSHNIYISYALTIGENYFQNFMPHFLFIHGDSNPRHNPAVMGGFFLAELLLVIIGIIALFQAHRKLFIFLTGWVLVAPLATTLVSEPHALRSAFMIPPLIIFSTEGLLVFWMKAKNDLLCKIAFVTIAIIFIIQFLFMIERVYFLSPNLFGQFWSYPAKQASIIASENKSQFDYIVLSPRIDDIEYAYPVYEKIDPKIVIDQNKNKTNLSGFLLKKMDNVYIGSPNKENLINFINSLSGSVMYVGPVQEKDALGGNVIYGKNLLPILTSYQKN